MQRLTTRRTLLRGAALRGAGLAATLIGCGDDVGRGRDALARAEVARLGGGTRGEPTTGGTTDTYPDEQNGR